MSSGPVATILIPTHDHTECLRHSIGSVLDQSIQDFELFVVGDGVPPKTRAYVDDLAARDHRIRFFDFKKGPRKGESYRHAALRHASGRIVAYLGDDDLWMPNHLATLSELLDDADFGHTLHIGIDGSGTMYCIPADLEDPQYRERMLNELFNVFDFTFGGHRLDAYRRLLSGWSPPPPGVPWSDLHMWRKFLAEPWCRAKSAMIPTGICTHTHQRPHLTDRKRARELARLRASLAAEGYRDRLWRMVQDGLAAGPRPVTNPPATIALDRSKLL